MKHLHSRHTTYFSIEARSRVLLLMKIYKDGGSSDFHRSVSTSQLVMKGYLNEKMENYLIIIASKLTDGFIQ